MEAADPAPRQLIRSLFRLLRIMRFMLIYIYFWLTFNGLAADYTRCSQIEIRVRSEYRDDEIHVLENKESKSAVCLFAFVIFKSNMFLHKFLHPV